MPAPSARLLGPHRRRPDNRGVESDQSTGGLPNYNGNGNASALANPDRDLHLTVMGLGWITLTALEQLLPVTHRGWDGWFGAIARAMTAVGLAIIGCCCLIDRVLIMCH